MDKFIDHLEQLFIIWGPKILIAILILIIGLKIINWLTQFLKRFLGKRRIDPSVYRFMVSVVNVTLKVMLLITVASQAGIPTTSFVAIISASALAVGLALSGNLSNFASGVLILIFKPYKIGDLITVGSNTGTVAEIQIFNTILTTEDDKKIIIPNSVITSGAIINITSNGSMRCDLKFTIGTGEDIDRARSIIISEIRKNELVKAEPETKVFVNNTSPGEIELVVHPWIEQGNYWEVFYDLQERIKKALHANGIGGPVNFWKKEKK